MTGPRIGVLSTEYRAVCDYGDRPGAPRCGERAMVHVMSESPTYGLVGLATCDEHLPAARAAGLQHGEHPYRGWCGFPGARFFPEECVFDADGVEPELTATAAARGVA